MFAWKHPGKRIHMMKSSLDGSTGNQWQRVCVSLSQIAIGHGIHSVKWRTSYPYITQDATPLDRPFVENSEPPRCEAAAAAPKTAACKL